MTYVLTGFLVIIGGSLGAVGRHVLTSALPSPADRRGAGRPGLPLATLLVNVSGSLLLGVVVGLADLGSAGGPGGLALIGIGFCGAFTTFSSFALDLVSLVEARAWVVLGQYVGASVVGGVGAAWFGLQLVSWWG